MKPEWKLIILITLALLLGALAMMAQGLMVPEYYLRLSTNYAVAMATDGTNYSASSNEISFTNRTATLEFDASPAANVTYVIASGRKSGSYTRTNNIGTNTATVFPAPLPPAVVRLFCGDMPCLVMTNPPGHCFYRSYLTTDGNYVSISDSTDLMNWNSSFLLVPSGDPNLTISAEAK